MAQRKLNLAGLLIGSTVMVSVALGAVLIKALSSMLVSIAMSSFIDDVNADMFEYVDRLETNVQLNDKQAIVNYLDTLLLRANINYAALDDHGVRYESSFGALLSNVDFKEDTGVDQNGDDTFFVRLGLSQAEKVLIVGFDETSLVAYINKINGFTLLFVSLYALAWITFVAVLAAYIRKRISILSHMSDDISNGRSLNVRRFAIRELDGLAWSLVNMDKQLRQRGAELQHMVGHDALTGIPNRYHFNEYLRHQLTMETSREPLALILIDIDRFKQVNDTYGHLFGDRLIRYVALCLKRIVGSTGLAARIGGDEYALIIGYDDDAQLDNFCRQVLTRINGVISLDGVRLSVSLSMGVATCLQGDTELSLERLVHRADMALYNSKRARISVCYHDEKLFKKNLRFQEIIRSLQENDFQHSESGFGVHYQPKYSLFTGEFVGVEALVRWFHPKLGYIEAQDIVEAVTQVSLLDGFTDRILDLVIDALCEWRRSGISLKVAINIAPSEVTNTRFAKQLQTKLEAHNLGPEHIELEITEHAVLDQDERVYRRLQWFKKQGFSIAIDDFGVGYANFRNLRNYPFSTIKIDRAFVAEIISNPRDRVIVQATTQVASELSMEVVAEGVEDESCVSELIALGCEYGQGYLFCRPVAKEAIPDLYNNNHVPNMLKKIAKKSVQSP